MTDTPSEDHPAHAHEDADDQEESEERTSVPDDFEPEEVETEED
jgi:hypothetical protein